MEEISIGIIGNPNSGKSTIFNELTGLKQKAANWSGVTVEKKVGRFYNKNHKVQLVDLPGLYSLGVGGKTSLDQKIAINYIKEGNFDCIINVIDSVNFKKSLYLTLQLLEREIPVILVFNMEDISKNKGIFIDHEKISELLKCPVISISAKNRGDIIRLKDFLIESKKIKNSLDIFDFYSKKISKYYFDVENFLRKKFPNISNEEKIELLEGNYQNFDNELKKFIKKIYKDLEKEFGQTSDLVLVNSRYNFIEKISKQICKSGISNSQSFSDKIDNIVLNKFLSVPIFLLSLYLMFVFSINIGGVFQEFFSLIAEATFIDIPLYIISKIYMSGWINILIHGLGGAVQTIASFIPIIMAMYIFLSFLEDSGYIARSAVIANKMMKIVGLSGQSFLPLMVGFGCNVPAITGARMLSNHSERISTIMMMPFISCTARLAVYTLFCYIFFPNNTQNIIFVLYILGICMALITGLLLKGKSQNLANSNMLIELPEYKLPKFKTIINTSLIKTKSFIFGAGKTIIVVFFIIHLINSIEIPIKNGEGKYHKENIINIFGKNIVHIFKPIGLKNENWPAAVGIITGIFAKEIVVGTLVSLYSDKIDKPDNQKQISIVSKYKRAFFSIFEKIKGVLTDNFDKLYNLTNTGAINNYYEDNQINNSIIRNISKNFEDKIAVLSYLIFILIYFPCVSVFGVISNEIGKKWALISAIWSTISAYSISVIFYQVSNLIINSNINYVYLLLGSFILITSSFLLRYICITNRSIIV
ncbi:ferrous iron transport protein B [Candidatus Aquarickettsia rohweri]|uniref:Ferrous iron transport protein B n=1 Tax=Candidatus Aquarickettsia rohweri TaxID=2602574 RepID=A0A429XUT6_9RICK|nr:ferrous iron transport protein B [Candidatus Aquarickettsia rohweri]RST71949.1 ferrous iron transport protein B [Candidatus Aquarickettsia rohweri]